MIDSILNADPATSTPAACALAIQAEVNRVCRETGQPFNKAWRQVTQSHPEVMARAGQVSPVNANDPAPAPGTVPISKSMQIAYDDAFKREMEKTPTDYFGGHQRALNATRLKIDLTGRLITPMGVPALGNDASPFCPQDYSILAFGASANADDDTSPGSHKAAALAHHLAAAANLGKDTKVALHGKMAAFHAEKAGITLPDAKAA